MTTPAITIHLIDEPGGAVAVLTSATAPIPGAHLTPAQALALELTTMAGRRAQRVAYWQSRDKALDLVRNLIDPDVYGYSVSIEVHDAARNVLGMGRAA